MSDRTCSIEDCDNPRDARGWCRKHYLRWYKYGDPQVVKPAAVERTHGYSVETGNGTPTYRSWIAMRQRVLNPNHTAYAHYGGRGITIDPRWDDFEAFLADVGECPPDPPDWKGKSRYYSLDRIDNDGNYELGNVRWATQGEQANNRRKERERTHCQRGHEFSDENTYVTPAGRRRCRTCARMRARRQRRERQV